MAEIDDTKLAEMETELEALRPLKETSAQAATALATKEAEWLAEKTRLESEINPNWREARETIKNLQAAALKNGIKLDDKGNPIVEQTGPSLKEIEETTTKATRNAMLNERFEEILGQYAPEEAKLVEHYFKKLTAGEEVSMKNIAKFVDQAEAAAGITASPTRKPITTGQGPRSEAERGATGPSENTKQLADLMGIKIED